MKPSQDKQSSQQAKLLVSCHLAKSASNLGTHIQNLKRRKVRDAAKKKREDGQRNLADQGGCKSCCQEEDQRRGAHRGC